MAHWGDVDQNLRDAVKNGALSPNEARMIQSDRDMRDSGKLVVIQAAPGADYLSQEQADLLKASVKDATGAGRVLILPPGYSLQG